MDPSNIYSNIFVSYECVAKYAQGNVLKFLQIVGLRTDQRKLNSHTRVLA